MTYTQHLTTKDILRNTTAIIRNGTHYRLLNGELIPEADFRERYKLPVRCNICEENPDRTKLFLS